MSTAEGNGGLGADPGGRGRFLAARAWLRGYPRQWLRADLLAAVMLAAYMLPAALGDATLANLKPEAGLYACIFGGLVFWLFCSSRHTVVTVTSAISLLIGASLGEIAGGDASRFGALAGATALLVAALAFLAWLFRAGVLVNFISESAMVGFKSGVALCLISTQLPKLCGVHGAHEDFWENMGAFLSHLGETNLVALAVGGGALVILVAGKIWMKRLPVALFVVVGGILLSLWLNLENHGVKLIPAVEKVALTPDWPDIRRSDLNLLLPLAMACFLLGAVETTAVGRTFGAKHRNRLDGNQELLALASANLAAGLTRGYPISGGMSQSLVNEGAGARSPLSGLIAAVMLFVVAKYCSHWLQALPQAVLAAVVLVAVAGLIKVDALKRFWTHDRGEFLVAMAALLGVLGSGLLRGVLIGAVISLVQILRRASTPHVAVLGRIPGTRTFSDSARHPDNEAIPGILIFRPEVSCLYFNIDHIRDSIMGRVRAADPLPRLVLLDLGSSPYMDLQGAQVLASTAEELAAAGICVRVVGARAAVRDRLRRERASEQLGLSERSVTVDDAVKEFLTSPTPQ